MSVVVRYEAGQWGEVEKAKEELTRRAEIVCDRRQQHERNVRLRNAVADSGVVGLGRVVCTHTHTHARTHTHTRTHTHARTHTHTQVQEYSKLRAERYRVVSQQRLPSDVYRTPKEAASGQYSRKQQHKEK